MQSIYFCGVSDPVNCITYIKLVCRKELKSGQMIRLKYLVCSASTIIEFRHFYERNISFGQMECRVHVT